MSGKADSCREKLLAIHGRNLERLIEQVAHFGREYAPVHILNSVEHVISEIEILCHELNRPLPVAIYDGYRVVGKTSPIKIPTGGSLREQPAAGLDYKFDAFLSHSSADKDIVRDLAHSLKAENITVWLDEEQIQPGDTITRRIEEGLSNSKYVLLCLSDNLLRSNWCRIEYEAILQKEIEHDNLRLIPVIVGAYTDESTPILISGKAYVDLRRGDGLDKLIKRLRH